MHKSNLYYDPLLEEKSFEFQYRNTETRKELNLDDEDLRDYVQHTWVPQKETAPYLKECFRCGNRSFVAGKTPYSMSCNWDSLN